MKKDDLKLFVYQHIDFLEKVLWGIFPTAYFRFLHDLLVEWINEKMLNILEYHKVISLLFALMMIVLCFVFPYLILKILRKTILPSPNFLNHQQVYINFLTKLKEDLGRMHGVNRNQMKNFRFSIYREFMNYPKKGQTSLYCCARINDHNSESSEPRVWQMKNKSDGKNAGVIGASLARGEKIHLYNELKSFDALKKMLERKESLKEYSEVLNIKEEDLIKDLEANDSKSIGVHRYPEELLCIPLTNVSVGRRLVLVIDCGISVSAKKRKNTNFVKKVEESFLDFEQDVIKEIETLHCYLPPNGHHFLAKNSHPWSPVRNWLFSPAVTG